MRYVTELLDGSRWYSRYDTRIVDTRDGGVVYDKLGHRGAEIICGLLNDNVLLEADGRGIVPGCIHNVQERHAHMGNPVCDECEGSEDGCPSYLPF